MSKTARVVAVAVGTVFGVALIVYYITSYLVVAPPTVAATKERHLTLQTVASIGFGPHHDWVSYLVRDSSGKWVHSTIFEAPAYSTVSVTIYQYDTATGLRNPFWGQPRGTVGGTFATDGKTLDVLNPDLASHTFAVPDLGLSVPLKGVADDAKNQCSVAPCTLAQAHTTVTFSFKTGKPGKYRWQCFVPCAAGFLLGNGGPMQTLGYMGGFLIVK
jgi:hypothetical protein